CPLPYDSTCHCFVRRAKFTNDNGYERLRFDTITFVDTHGDTMSLFNRKALGKFFHKRHVMKSKGPYDIDVLFDIQVEVKTEGTDKVGIWNATMSGTFNGQEFKSGTVTNVKRVVVDHHFAF